MPDHEFLPPRGHAALIHLGSYRRVLPVSLERLYENALDWAHLPHVHTSSFRTVACRAAGPWGWCVDAIGSRGDATVLELRLDRATRRWITRVLDGPGAGAEIWTQVVGHAREPRPELEIVVDFFAAQRASGALEGPQQRARAGRGYARLYARLYDEDVAMMRERQRQLDRRIEPAREAGELELGPLQSLDLPCDVRLGGRDYVLMRGASGAPHDLLAFPRQCPHQLGPLTADALDGDVVTCPWHGYRFDARTGANLSGQGCTLTQLPEVTLRADGWVVLKSTA